MDVVGDLRTRFRPAGVVDELRIVVDVLIRNGLEVDRLGADGADLGDVERLRVGNKCFVIGLKNDDDDDVEDLSLLSLVSAGVVLRDCLDKEDMIRVAAAMGPLDRRSVKELVLCSLDLVVSSLGDTSSVFDKLNKYIQY